LETKEKYNSVSPFHDPFNEFQVYKHKSFIIKGWLKSVGAS